MFDIGWTEMMVVACVAIIVVGPKDLPGMLRTFGKAIGNVRRLAGDFQRQFNDAIRESDLEDVQKSVSGAKSFEPLADAQKAMADFQDTMKDHIALKDSEKSSGTDDSAVNLDDDFDDPAIETEAPAPSKPKNTAKKPTRKRAPAKRKSAASSKSGSAAKAAPTTKKRSTTAAKKAPAKRTRSAKTTAKQDSA